MHNRCPGLLTALAKILTQRYAYGVCDIHKQERGKEKWSINHDNQPWNPCNLVPWHKIRSHRQSLSFWTGELLCVYWFSVDFRLREFLWLMSKILRLSDLFPSPSSRIMARTKVKVENHATITSLQVQLLGLYEDEAVHGRLRQHTKLDSSFGYSLRRTNF